MLTTAGRVRAGVADDDCNGFANCSRTSGNVERSQVQVAVVLAQLVLSEFCVNGWEVCP